MRQRRRLTHRQWFAAALRLIAWAKTARARGLPMADCLERIAGEVALWAWEPEQGTPTEAQTALRAGRRRRDLERD